MKSGSWTSRRVVSPSLASAGSELLRATPLHVVRGGRFENEFDAQAIVSNGNWILGSELCLERSASMCLIVVCIVELERFESLVPSSGTPLTLPLLPTSSDGRALSACGDSVCPFELLSAASSSWPLALGLTMRSGSPPRLNFRPRRGSVVARKVAILVTSSGSLSTESEMPATGRSKDTSVLGAYASSSGSCAGADECTTRGTTMVVAEEALGFRWKQSLSRSRRYLHPGLGQSMADCSTFVEGLGSLGAGRHQFNRHEIMVGIC
jgi:hypothetical protein